MDRPTPGRHIIAIIAAEVYGNGSDCWLPPVSAEGRCCISVRLRSETSLYWQGPRLVPCASRIYGTNSIDGQPRRHVIIDMHDRRFEQYVTKINSIQASCFALTPSSFVLTWMNWQAWITTSKCMRVIFRTSLADLLIYRMVTSSHTAVNERKNTPEEVARKEMLQECFWSQMKSLSTVCSCFLSIRSTVERCKFRSDPH